MTTARKIEFSPLALSAGVVAIAAQNSDLPQTPQDSPSGLSLVRRSTTVTTAAPTLKSEAAASSPEKAEDSEDAKEVSLIDTLIKMIQLVLGLQLALSENQATQSKVNSAISDKSLEVMQKALDDQLKKIHEMEIKIKKAKKAHFWQKTGMTILGALAVVATFVFLGPVAGTFALGLFVAQQTGGTEKMFSGLPPKYRLVAEIGFAVGVGLLGGGLQGVADGALAGAAAAAESGGQAATASSVEIELATITRQAAQQEAQQAAAQTSSNVVKSSAESSAVKPDGPTPKEAFMDSFKGASFNLTMQSFMSTTGIMDMAQLMTKDKKKQMWVALALSVLFAFSALGGGMKMGGGSLSMSEALPEAAKTSNGWAAVNNMMKLLRNPYLIGGLTVDSSAVVTYFGIKAGKLRESQGDIQEEMGHNEAMMTISKMLADLMTALVKSQSQYGRQQMESLQASTDRWQELTEPAAVAARVLA